MVEQGRTRSHRSLGSRKVLRFHASLPAYSIVTCTLPGPRSSCENPRPHLKELSLSVLLERLVHTRHLWCSGYPSHLAPLDRPFLHRREVCSGLCHHRRVSCHTRCGGFPRGRGALTCSLASARHPVPSVLWAVLSLSAGQQLGVGPDSGPRVIPECEDFGPRHSVAPTSRQAVKQMGCFSGLLTLLAWCCDSDPLGSSPSFA